jgi:serine/threonine-protein kinase RsbW
MPEADDCLFIKLPARSEHLAAVRHAVGSVARQFGMSDPGVADLQIVVTEACSNVVVHAYRNLPEGPLEVEARCDSREFGVIVRDFGTGFRSHVAPDAISLRLGLAMISTLANGFQVSEREGGGTEVSVRLPLLCQ